jgi:hypothetical protein
MTTYADHEKEVIRTATKFVACYALGRATYDKRSARNLKGARSHANQIIAERNGQPGNKGRPVLIYAVNGTNQVVAETVYPAKH